MSLINRKFPSFPSFNDFFDDPILKKRFDTENWMPAVNIADNKDSYEIEVAAPGIKKEAFNVVVEHGILTISGKGKKEEEEKEKNYTRKEFYSTSFSRSFTLPENVSEDDIKAEYHDGVLKLKLVKKMTKASPKKLIEIS